MTEHLERAEARRAQHAEDTRAHNEKKAVLGLIASPSLMRIAIDTYDDLFSDFDSSPYPQRALSDDLLKELQKRYTETPKGEVEVRFSMPSRLRSHQVEAVARKRLKDYFQAQVKLLNKEMDDRKKMAAALFAGGFAVLLGTIYLTEYVAQSHILEVTGLLITPLGWFGMWEGTSRFVDYATRYEEKRKFFQRFARANYVFMNEEDFVREFLPEGRAHRAGVQSQLG